MKEELRLYSFVNFYLSSIQQGIQTGHMAVDLVRKYTNSSIVKFHPEREICVDWADNHKTFIILNGGDSYIIKSIAMKLHNLGKDLSLPYEYFDEPGCDGMTTCCGVIVPQRLFDCVYDVELDRYVTNFPVDFGEACAWSKETPEYQLIKLIKSCSLSR